MDKIINLVAQVLRVSTETVNDETKMIDLIEWDSLSHMSLITEIESAFSIQLDGDEIARMTSISEIKRVIDTHKSSC